MYSISIKALIMICLLTCLTGCWNSKELTEFGFTMGASLDQSEDGRIELNVQIYSPRETIGGAGAGGDKPPYITIKAVNESYMDAARHLPHYYGRKAQWSHMRVLLIGEQFAKENDIGEVLDFFYRDHETRLTTLLMITKGKAADFWKIRPFIERSMAQQLRTIIEGTPNISGKSKEALLLDTALQLNSKVQIALIPYFETDEQQEIPYSSGMAIIRKGKMIDRLTSEEVKQLLMLTNEFKRGVIEFPCMGNVNNKESKKETIEIQKLKTKISPDFSESPPKIHLKTKIEGVIGELNCTRIATKEEVKKVEDHIKNMVKDEFEALIDHIQEKKVDVLGIGNKLYQKDPNMWKELENSWDEIFADIQFVIDVEVNIKGTGMPLGEKVTEE